MQSARTRTPLRAAGRPSYNLDSMPVYGAAGCAAVPSVRGFGRITVPPPRPGRRCCHFSSPALSRAGCGPGQWMALCVVRAHGLKRICAVAAHCFVCGWLRARLCRCRPHARRHGLSCPSVSHATNICLSFQISKFLW